MKYIKFSMITIAMLVFLTGCAHIGSLNERDRETVRDFLIKQEIVDEIISEDIIGAGEGEYVTYIYDVKKGDAQYQLQMQQRQVCEGYRIFEIYKDSDLDEDVVYLKITSAGDVSIEDKGYYDNRE